MEPLHDFEAGVFGSVTGYVQNGSGACLYLVEGHGVSVADNFPDALPPVLDVDEEASSAVRQRKDAETAECRIVDIVGGLSGHKRLDTGLRKDDVWHKGFSCIQLQPENRDGRDSTPYGEIDNRK